MIIVLFNYLKYLINAFFSVTGAQIEPLANELFTNLFNVLDRPVSEENEYIMKGR